MRCHASFKADGEDMVVGLPYFGCRVMSGSYSDYHEPLCRVISGSCRSMAFLGPPLQFLVEGFSYTSQQGNLAISCLAFYLLTGICGFFQAGRSQAWYPQGRKLCRPRNVDCYRESFQNPLCSIHMPFT